MGDLGGADTAMLPQCLGAAAGCEPLVHIRPARVALLVGDQRPVGVVAALGNRELAKRLFNEAFTMFVKDPLVIGAPCPAMLDVVFWWCAFVALTGAYVLVGIALVIGGWSKSQRAGVKLTSEATLVMRHFGRA